MIHTQALQAVRDRILGPEPPAVICFDFFDTLVTRKVYPEATKRLAAKNLAAALGNALDGETIYGIRAGLEKRICKDNHRRGFDLEFSVAEMATELFSVLELIKGASLHLDREDFIELVEDIEIQTELRVQQPLEDTVHLLQFVKQNNIVTCLISDFYLPARLFSRLLEHHGIKQHFDHLFVSADYKVGKGGSGGLYKIVADTLRVEPRQMVMLGDNHHADVVMAQQAGLSAFHLDRSDIRERYEAMAAAENNGVGHRVVLEEGFTKVFTSCSSMNFAEMGLSLWLFTHKLFHTLYEDSKHTVFFCSKEGEFLRRLFVQYQELRFGRQLIDAKYLLVSRKATFICSLRALEEEDFSRLFSNYRDLSLKEFLLSLNFSEVEARKLCEQHGFDFGQRYTDLSQQDVFLSLRQSPSFKASYERHRKSQKENFRTYLSSFGIQPEKDGLALVDVGWKGSIQNNIFYALDAKVSISGYYLGLLSPTELSEKNNKKGVLFSDYPAHSPYIHAYNNNRSLFEMLLGATHGSADGYFTQEEYLEQQKVRKSMEFTGKDVAGKVIVTVVDLPEERVLYEQKIRPLQENMAEMNRLLTEQFCALPGDPPALTWFAKHHARMVFSPTLKEVDFFSELYHLENFGLFEFTEFNTAKKISLIKRLSNLRTLLRDPAAVLETGVWPPVILRRLGLEFLQPLDGRKRYKRVLGGQ